jgi:ABC-type transport system involved in multi-copper enzyme maturation permease subunit
VSFGFQHPFSLVAGAAMVMVMATVPAAEREAGLLDLILTRPLPRSRYLAATALLVLLSAILPPLALLAGSGLGLAVVEVPQGVSWADYIPSALALTLLLLAIGSYALLFSTEARRRGIAVGQMVGMTLLFYWLDFLGDYWDTLEVARLLSPFHYFDPARAARSGIPIQDYVVLGGVALLCTLGAFLNFRRQDL